MLFRSFAALSDQKLKYVSFWSDNAAKLTERFGQWVAK